MKGTEYTHARAEFPRQVYINTHSVIKITQSKPTEFNRETTARLETWSSIHSDWAWEILQKRTDKHFRDIKL